MDRDALELCRNCVRVGTVSSVSGNTARVIFKDMDNMVSGHLIIVQQPHYGIPNWNWRPWTPEVGQSVLCLYIPIQDGDGYILGVI